jgi:hypothetical protein
MFFSISRTVPKQQILGLEKQLNSVGVSFFLGVKGGYRFRLFGYTSPKSLVEMGAVGISDQTYANNDGYFEFNDRFLPLTPKELCLTSKDQLGRISSPVCIPAFPTNQSAEIGPIIMPPTLSVNSPPEGKDYFMNEDISLSGQSIPNTEIDLSLFVDEKKSIINYLASSIISPVEAVTFPDLKTKSDDKGNFSLSMPSSRPDFFRLFAQTNYSSSRSPKSITLNVKVLPVWMIIFKFLSLCFLLIKSRLIEMIVLSQITVILIYFIRRYFHYNPIVKQRAITVRNHLFITKQQSSIIVRKTNLPIITNGFVQFNKT